MHEELYECLELMGLTLPEINKQINKLKNIEVNETVNVLNNVIIDNDDELEFPNSLYNFVVNDNLSGGKEYCARIECRLDKASEMVNFASLYADTVLIKNPFEKYIKRKNYNMTIRESIANDIIILWYFMPLIKRGIIRFAKTEYHFCKECFEKVMKDHKKKVEDVYSILMSEYLNNINVYFENSFKYGCIEMVGPEDLIEHGSFYIQFTHYTPKEFMKYKNLKGRQKVDRETLENSGIMSYLPNIIINDFAIQEWYTKKYDFTYLTNRDIDIKIIDQTNDKNFNELNKKLFECISHQLPILKHADIQDIIKIRDKDGESFMFYRNNLKKLIRELPEKPSYVKEAFLDMIQPEIDKINITLKESRKSLLKNITKNILITSGIVYIGLTTGILPNNLKEVVASAGICGLAQAALGNITDNFVRPNKLRENPYYFLWKANRVVNN